MADQEKIDNIQSKLDCGTEIAHDVLETGCWPELIDEHGQGRAFTKLYGFGNGVEVIDANGGAIWSEQYTLDEWRQIKADHKFTKGVK